METVTESSLSSILWTTANTLAAAVSIYNQRVKAKQAKDER